MGIIYEIMPLDEYLKIADSDWLTKIGFVALPTTSLRRKPTPIVLRNALDGLKDIRVTYKPDLWSWTAEVVEGTGPDGPKTTMIRLSDFDGDEGHPSRVVAEKGSEMLILKIAERLAQICGPLVVDNDLDGAPVLVVPGIDLKIAYHSWLATSERISQLTAKFP